MNVIIADTSLSPSERDDKETDRRTRRQDPAPSRKRAERRAPRDDLRKKRVRPDDPDLKPLKRRKKRDDDGGRISTRPWVEEKTLNRFEKSIDEFYDDVDENEDPDWDELIDRLDLSSKCLRKMEKESKGPSWLSRMVKRVTDMFRRNKWSDVDEAQTSPEAQEDEEVQTFLKDLKRGCLVKKSSSRASAASYGPSTSMTARQGTYHGVLDQRGNPTDPPNTGWKSVDQRYIGEEHFKRILKCAAEMLKEDWLQYGWDGGAKDAPVRAALDMAIQTADSSAYQSKIDGDTYNLLLNRLAGWGHDTFSDTVLPMKAATTGDKRSASVMTKSQEYKNIVQVASDLRSSHPMMALQLMRSLRGITANDELGLGDAPMAPPAPEKSAGELGDFSFKSMSDDDFSKLKDDAKKEMDALFGEEDVEAFLSGLEKMIDGVQKKTASVGDSVLVPMSLLVRLAARSPEAKQAFGTAILAASKRKKSKKDDKAAGKKKEGKPNPFADKGKKEPKKGDKPDFGGKKAPPFPPQKGKKKSASVDVDDASW